jgi:dinuclear metal center YbgI/SA1388 family protein
MHIAEILSFLDSFAPPFLQESYDNAGLITGSGDWECTGVMVSLDTTESVVAEAIGKKCNLIISHHPFIFKGIKKINGKSWVERVIISAIQHGISIYAIHTNLDAVLAGVNGKIADKLELKNRSILAPKDSTLEKLFVFVPLGHVEKVRSAIFDAGGGQIGNYSECSFGTEGLGTFKAGEGTHPFAGETGRRQDEKETRIEVVLPVSLRQKVLESMIRAHPYEEVAYDLLPLANAHPGIGSGLIGDLPDPIEAKGFLGRLKEIFGLAVIRHSRLTEKRIERVAVCGGSGSFLISKALSSKADLFLTGDLKYHEFFDLEDRMVLADIGHFETEQFTTDLIADLLSKKFPTFAIQKTTRNTNPVYYFL